MGEQNKKEPQSSTASNLSRWGPFKGRRWADILSDEESSYSYAASKNSFMLSKETTSRWKLGQLFRRESTTTSGLLTADTIKENSNESPSAKLQRKTQFPLGFVSLMHFVSAGDEPATPVAVSPTTNSEVPECVTPNEQEYKPEPIDSLPERQESYPTRFTPSELIQHGIPVWRPKYCFQLSLAPNTKLSSSLETTSLSPVKPAGKNSLCSKVSPESKAAAKSRAHSATDENTPVVFAVDNGSSLQNRRPVRFGSLDYGNNENLTRRSEKQKRRVIILNKDSTSLENVRQGTATSDGNKDDSSSLLKTLLGVQTTHNQSKALKKHYKKKEVKNMSTYNSKMNFKTASGSGHLKKKKSTTAHQNDTSCPVSRNVISYRLRQIAIEKSTQEYEKYKQLKLPDDPPTPRSDLPVSAGHFSHLLHEWKCNVQLRLPVVS